jgi:beta-lactamase regulating signal transducer with metallopeptidase domain
VAAGNSNPTPSPFDLSDFFRTSMRTLSPSPTLAALALACYWLSLLFYGIKLWRAGRKTKALLTASDKREISEQLALIKERCQKEFGLKDVTILFSAQIAVPFTAGRRSIVLPEALLDYDARDLLSAAIGHEMAHIKRRDFAFNLIYE